MRFLKSRIDEGNPNEQGYVDPRDPGVEKLLVGLPDWATPERLEPTRRWAIALMASASRWQVQKRKRNALHTFGGRNDG